jgi:hypothetical protein
MSLVLIPEIVLLDTINRALKIIRKDYNDQTDKTKTWLSIMFQGLTFDGYNYYDQIVSILITTPKSPRHFQGDLMFNNKKESVPSFHIALASESPNGDGDSLGLSEQSDQDIIYDGNIDEEDSTQNTPTQIREVYKRRTQTNYNIVITSDNSQEVVVLYHVMKAIFIASVTHLSLKGIQNITFGGQDIQPYREVTPSLYMRSLNLGVQYESYSLDLDLKSLGSGVETSGDLVV